MKVLMINLPYYGHVIPTIGLVQELIKQGCEVSYLMPFDWENVVKESGATFIGYENHKQLAEQMKNARKVVEEIIDHYDFILYEQFFFIGKHLAKKYHKPCARIFTAPSTNKTLMNEFTSSGPLKLFNIKWISKGFTKDVSKGLELKTDNWLDEIIDNPPELNLVYTLSEYQPYREDFSDDLFKFIGPSIYERKTESIDFKKTNQPLIYISLGTVVKGATKFFQMCIDTFRDEDIDVIISVGKQFDLNKLKNVPSNIHVYPYVNQIEVLKMADVFVTHGGMNSVSEAFVSNTPMVVIPFASDQHVNARNIEKMNLGKHLLYENITSKKLKEAVMYLLHDSKIKDNYQEVQGWIEKAPGNQGAAKMIIQYYDKQKSH